MARTRLSSDTLPHSPKGCGCSVLDLHLPKVPTKSMFTLDILAAMSDDWGLNTTDKLTNEQCARALAWVLGRTVFDHVIHKNRMKNENLAGHHRSERYHN